MQAGLHDTFDSFGEGSLFDLYFQAVLTLDITSGLSAKLVLIVVVFMQPSLGDLCYVIPYCLPLIFIKLAIDK